MPSSQKIAVYISRGWIIHNEKSPMAVESRVFIRIMYCSYIHGHQLVFYSIVPKICVIIERTQKREGGNNRKKLVNFCAWSNFTICHHFQLVTRWRTKVPKGFISTTVNWCIHFDVQRGCVRLFIHTWVRTSSEGLKKKLVHNIIHMSSYCQVSFVFLKNESTAEWKIQVLFAARRDDDKGRKDFQIISVYTSYPTQGNFFSQG